MSTPARPSPDQPASATRGELALTQVTGRHSNIVATAQGAHVIEWSMPGSPPILYVSPRSHFARGKPIRGGVPVIFPWFGARADDAAAPQHGFARVRDWTLITAATSDDGEARVVYSFTNDATTQAMWPHAFQATLDIRASRRLLLALEIRNTGAAAFTFEAALHTYFAVSDVRTIRVHGLEETEYLDKTDGFRRKRQPAGPLQLTGETDRLYLGTDKTCRIDDPGWSRRIVVAKSGSHSTVVWNPWVARAGNLADLGADTWPDFVCVETVNAAADRITLAPGARHVLAAEISVEPIPSPA